MSRPSRVLLVRNAPTAATRTSRFPSDEPLDRYGERTATLLAGQLDADVAVRGPAERCRATAAAAGHPDAQVVDQWRAPDHGDWTGRRLQYLVADDPAAVARWRSDPDHAPPGGESVRQLAARTTAGLVEAREPATTAAVFTHGALIRLAVLVALDAPLPAFWHVDVAPGHVTELHGRPDGGWRVARVNVPPHAITPSRPHLVPERA